ncbi:MAG: GNAT family N-acetyltransferase [Maribacter sp.]|nr:GNAT family N-acetyltransferase [Maribacter sp.]
MKKKLDHTNTRIAKKIRAVFQASYTVEAQLLKATNFPPLQRSLESFIKSENAFLGYLKNGELAGVIEVDTKGAITHIQSLVVHPQFFRQGIAQSLLEFVLSAYDSALFTVETGLENSPATQLYQKFGFTEVKQWDTDHGVRKIRFEKRI